MPGIPKWTKKTVGEHITVGGLGATPVGTPQQVADSMERWVEEADVDGFNLVSPVCLCFSSRGLIESK
jgi:alkanesulfonate monooxygenase SsuD/methylene tetrahydromethanopterin reductase-like flavin-dependent oxidoreductase (luciferase family)